MTGAQLKWHIGSLIANTGDPSYPERLQLPASVSQCEVSNEGIAISISEGIHGHVSEHSSTSEPHPDDVSDGSAGDEWRTILLQKCRPMLRVWSSRIIALVENVIHIRAFFGVKLSGLRYEIASASL